MTKEYFFYRNGGIYKKASYGVVIRKGTDHIQPKIEENDGTNIRDIIDTVNGDARYITSNRSTGYGILSGVADIGKFSVAKIPSIPSGLSYNIKGVISRLRGNVYGGGSSIGIDCKYYSCRR